MDTVLLIKIISALVYPLGLSVLLGLLSLLSSGFNARRLTFILRFTAIAILLLASNSKVASALASSLERQYPQIPIADIAKHDVIIVLGGGLRIPLPPAQHVQLGSGSDRYWYATQLYRAAKGQRIVLVGGNVFEQHGYQSEAYYGRQLLQSWGVPPEAIIVEGDSRTTEQNMQNLNAMLAQQEISSALLVTSALHMPRSIDLFRQLPIPITPASADILVREHYSPVILSWVPSAGALALTSAALHEYYGRWFNQIKQTVSLN